MRSSCQKWYAAPQLEILSLSALHKKKIKDEKNFGCDQLFLDIPRGLLNESNIEFFADLIQNREENSFFSTLVLENQNKITGFFVEGFNRVDFENKKTKISEFFNTNKTIAKLFFQNWFDALCGDDKKAAAAIDRYAQAIHNIGILSELNNERMIPLVSPNSFVDPLNPPPPRIQNKITATFSSDVNRNICLLTTLALVFSKHSKEAAGLAIGRIKTTNALKENDYELESVAYSNLLLKKLALSQDRAWIDSILDELELIPETLKCVEELDSYLDFIAIYYEICEKQNKNPRLGKIQKIHQQNIPVAEKFKLIEKYITEKTGSNAAAAWRFVFGQNQERLKNMSEEISSAYVDSVQKKEETKEYDDGNFQFQFYYNDLTRDNHIAGKTAYWDYLQKLTFEEIKSILNTRDENGAELNLHHLTEDNLSELRSVFSKTGKLDARKELIETLVDQYRSTTTNPGETIVANWLKTSIPELAEKSIDEVKALLSQWYSPWSQYAVSPSELLAKKMEPARVNLISIPISPQRPADYIKINFCCEKNAEALSGKNPVFYFKDEKLALQSSQNKGSITFLDYTAEFDLPVFDLSLSEAKKRGDRKEFYTPQVDHCSGGDIYFNDLLFSSRITQEQFNQFVYKKLSDAIIASNKTLDEKLKDLCVVAKNLKIPSDFLYQKLSANPQLKFEYKIKSEITLSTTLDEFWAACEQATDKKELLRRDLLRWNESLLLTMSEHAAGIDNPHTQIFKKACYNLYETKLKGNSPSLSEEQKSSLKELATELRIQPEIVSKMKKEETPQGVSGRLFEVTDVLTEKKYRSYAQSDVTKFETYRALSDNLPNQALRFNATQVKHIVRGGEGADKNDKPGLLVGANLRDIDLSNMNFTRVKPGKNTSVKKDDIEAAVDFTDCLLEGVNFANTDLRFVKFTNAQFDEKTNFSGAIINKETDFTRTVLTKKQVEQLLGVEKLLSQNKISRNDYNALMCKLDVVLKSTISAKTTEAVLNLNNGEKATFNSKFELNSEVDYGWEWRTSSKVGALFSPSDVPCLKEGQVQEFKDRLKAVTDSFDAQSVFSTVPKP